MALIQAWKQGQDKPLYTSHTAYVATSTESDEVKSMDSYIQILCRFQRKVPPPFTLSTKKFEKLGFFAVFLELEELFAYIFEIYIKFGYKNPSILTVSDLVDVAT